MTPLLMGGIIFAVALLLLATARPKVCAAGVAGRAHGPWLEAARAEHQAVVDGLPQVCCSNCGGGAAGVGGGGVCIRNNQTT